MVVLASLIIKAKTNMYQSSKVSSVMKWWSKCISMVIAKTASRNVAFKATRLGDSIFDRQSEALRTEAAQVNSPSHEEDFDDVGCNADLYASRQARCVSGLV